MYLQLKCSPVPCFTLRGKQLPCSAQEHTQHSSVPSASPNCNHTGTDTALGVWKTLQECTKEMHYRNIKSWKEWYYGYYPNLKIHLSHSPCLPLQIPDFICSSQGSQQAPLQCQHFLLLPCSMCQAKEKQQRLVLFLEKNGFCRSHWASPLMHTQACALYSKGTSASTFWCSFSMESIPWNVSESCVWDRSLRGFQKNPLWWQLCCAPAEPGRLRCVSCPLPPIVTGKVVTSSSLNLSPYFALPSWW